MEKGGSWRVGEEEAVACCGSTLFGKVMARASPFTSLDHAIACARDIWFNKVDVRGWLEAFEAHPQIGQQSPPLSSSPNTTTTSTSASASAQWSRGEQSTALATATSSTSQQLSDWNARYRQKFGFVFLICASGRTTDEILSQIKVRFQNRPILELDIAAQEHMKITELRLAKLFSAARSKDASASDHNLSISAKNAQEDQATVIGAHLTAGADSSSQKASRAAARTRPPITTHVLDVSRGSPASGIEVSLEIWKGCESRPPFLSKDAHGWQLIGSSATDADGRSGKLMDTVEFVSPGVYRISFNTSAYCPSGFFPHVSVVFEIAEHQTGEHFHVPLLLSPFSFTTYRGS